MSDPSGIVREMHQALRDFPPDGRPGWTAQDTGVALIVRGYIQSVEVTKQCKCCGTDRLDYSYFRITAAGRQFLEDRNEIEALILERNALRELAEAFIDIEQGTDTTGYTPHVEQMLMDLAAEVRIALSKEAAQIEGADR